jgi:hypothetical protein
MKYIKVRWIHNFPDEPTVIYSELNNARFEVRKVEIFSDGRKGYASLVENFGSTKLGIEPVPTIEEISEDVQFQPKEITKEEFEKVWLERLM